MGFWKSADTTTGYKRRWLLLPFPNTFGITPGFSESFADEYPGILTKAVTGLRRLMERGEFDPPPSALAEKDRFELAADQVREWLNDDPALEVADPKDHGTSTPAAECYRAYRRWAETQGATTVSAQKFRQRLESAGYKVRKSGVVRVYGMKVNALMTHLSNPLYAAQTAPPADLSDVEPAL